MTNCFMNDLTDTIQVLSTVQQQCPRKRHLIYNRSLVIILLLLQNPPDRLYESE